MNKRKKELIVIAALAPVLIIVLVSSIQKMRARSLRVNAKTESVAENVENSVDVEQQRLQQQWFGLLEQQQTRELQYLDDGFARNPFVLEEQLYVEEEIQLTLNGLLSHPEQSAIVNGDIVTPGSFVQGFLVENIQDDEVILKRSGKQFKLRVGKPLKLIIRRRN